MSLRLPKTALICLTLLFVSPFLWGQSRPGAGTGTIQTPDPARSPENLSVVTIGDGTELPGSPRVPIDFYWNTSLSETIYFADEIGQPAGSQITKIGYFNDFSDEPTEKPVKVYMGETSLQDLNGGWITSNNLIEVFSGTVTFPTGSNEIIIPLHRHYTYQGKNLVIMVYREKDTMVYDNADRFYATIDQSRKGRTLAISLDANELFTLYPENPPIHLTPTDHFPNISLYVMPGSNTTIYATDFETFTIPGQVACQYPVQWTTWENEPCGEQDAEISDDFHHSGTKSARVDNAVDLVLRLGNRTTGKYELSFFIYIPSGFCGYYNLLQNFGSAESKFGLEVYFHSDGTGFINADGYNTAQFNYAHNQWLPIKNIIDLNGDVAELMIGGASIHTWPWSAGATGTDGIRQLSAADFFAGVDENYPSDVPKYYIDDPEYKALDAPTCADLVVYPSAISQNLQYNTSTSRILTITNNGNTDHTFSIEPDYVSKSAEGSFNGKTAPRYGASTVYYNQTGNPSAETGVLSQTFITDLPDRICAAADDFIVPPGENWNITHVFAAGYYVSYVIHGEVPFVNVIFYADSSGYPGPAVHTFNAIPAHSDAAGDVNVFLPASANLTSGTYWVSVAAYMSYSTNRYWYWSKEATPAIQNEFAWKNPPGGLSQSCMSWCHASDYQPDKLDRNLTFALTDSVYVTPTSWLSVSPANGTIPAGGSIDVQLAIDPGNVTGTHQSNLVISTDDQVVPLRNVPISLKMNGEPGELPLVEGWDSDFLSRKWELDPITIQWNVNTANGNPKPEAWFFRPVNILNYSFSLVTQTLDAREILDNVTLKYDVKFQNPSTRATLECLSVEVYDGSEWQLICTHKNTQGGFGYLSKTFDITPHAAGKIFSVRFRVNGANTSNINVWEVDNIQVYQEEVGHLEGFASRLSDGSMVEGAVVTLINPQGEKYVTSTQNNGHFMVNRVKTGGYLLSIKKKGLNVVYDSITIVYGETLSKHYRMTAPTLTADPESVSVVVPVNQTATQTVTLYNEGNGPLGWIANFQSDSRKVSIPVSNGDFPRGSSPPSLERAPAKGPAHFEPARGAKGPTGFAFDLHHGMFFSFDTDDPGTPSAIATFDYGPFGGTFDAYQTSFLYVIDVSNDHLIKVDVISGTVTDIGKCDKIGGHTFTGLQIDKTTNTLYAVSAKANLTESQLYTIDKNTGITTPIGSLGLPACIDIAIDGSGQMYGYDIITDQSYKIDKTTAVSTLLGSIGFDANWAQGMSWNPDDDIIYLAAFNDWTQSGELRRLDVNSGNTEFVGNFRGEVDALAFPGGGSTWFAFEPITGQIEAGGSQEVTITFDGSHINEDESPVETGILVFKPDVTVADIDPAPVDLTMTIQGPMFGILNGTVTHSSIPVGEVEIRLVRENSPIEYTYFITTGPDGRYGFNEAIHGTYTLTAWKEGYNLYTVGGIAVTGDQTTTHDINLVAPIMNVNPLEINAATTEGETVVTTMTISNSGDGFLEWQSYISVTNEKISIPASDGRFPRTNIPPSAGPAPMAPQSGGSPSGSHFRGSTAYAFDLSEEKLFISFDTDDPGTKNIISAVDFLAVGSDFDGKDFSFMYVIDYDNFELKKIILETGEVTSVGPCVPREEHIWSGIAVNKLTNTMYGVSTNIDESALYTINMFTGEATEIGGIDIPAAIDCAIDGQGVMYSYCIVNQESYRVNLETLETTSLGPIGFDANYAQGMAWDPATDIIYLTAFNQEAFRGELRILDKETGNTEFLGAFDCEVDGVAFPGVVPWFTIEPRRGIIEPWAAQDVTVTMFSSLALLPIDYTLTGNIRLESDPNVGIVNVPVTLTVAPVAVDENESDGIAIYPNPTAGLVQIQSRNFIKELEIHSITGQSVYHSIKPGQKEMQLNLSELEPGVYLIRMVTDSGIHHRRLTMTR